MNIDPTINHFSMSLQRLLEGFITIQDKKGERMIAIANPSINDFVRSYLDTNSQEKEQLVSDSICVRQIERLLSDVELQQYKKQMFENRSVLEYHFDDELKKAAYIVEYISKYKILDKYYQPYIERYVKELKNVTVYVG